MSSNEGESPKVNFNRYFPIPSTLADVDSYHTRPWDVLDSVSGLLVPLHSEDSAYEAAGHLNDGVAAPDDFSWCTADGKYAQAPEEN